jgi:hypothetical protein
MPNFKCSIFLHSDINGWSENWYFSGTDYSSAMVALQSLADLRQALCGTGVSLDYLRVSDEAIQRDSYVVAPRTVTVPDTSASGGGSFGPKQVVVTWGSIDPPSSGVHVRIEATAQYHGSHTVRGVPDDLIVWPSGPSNLPGWDKAYGKWRSALIGSFSLRVRKQTGANAPLPITQMIPEGAVGTTPARWLFAVPGLGVKEGTKVRVLKLRGKPGSENPNGIWQVDSVDQGTGLFSLRDFPTQDDIPGFEPTAVLSGFMQIPDWDYPRITDVIIRGENNRKPGRPFDLRPGRRPVRR